MIQPALTPEEWTFPHHAMWMSPKMGIFATASTEEGHLTIRTPHAMCDGWDGKTLTIHHADDRHALAALCLHEQEFGFTSDEVGRLLRIAAYLDTPEVTASEDGWFLEAFAAKVRALLPTTR